MKFKKVISILLVLLFIIQIFQNYVYALEINSATIKDGVDCGSHIQFNSSR